MKRKALFFGLCAAMIIASEISAMQLVTKRASKSVHRTNYIEPMLQKRKYGEEGGFLIAMVLGYYMGQAVGNIGCVTSGNIFGDICDGAEKTYKYVRDPKVFRTEKLYYQIADIGSANCSFAYATKVPCSNSVCCKYLNNDIQRKEIFDDIDHKLHFLNVVKRNVQRLSEKEKEGQLLWAEGKITSEQCKEIAGLLEHKKDCHAKQLALFEQFMNE